MSFFISFLILFENKLKTLSLSNILKNYNILFIRFFKIKYKLKKIRKKQANLDETPYEKMVRRKNEILKQKEQILKDATRKSLIDKEQHKFRKMEEFYGYSPSKSMQMNNPAMNNLKAKNPNNNNKQTQNQIFSYNDPSKNNNQITQVLI